MPWAYLLVVGVIALAVAMTVRPIRRGPRLAAFSFYLGVGTGELPFVIWWLLAALTALAAVGHRLFAWPAVLALVAALTTAAAVVPILVGGLRARPVLEAALHDARLSPARRPRPWWRFVFWPWPTVPRCVQHVRDVAYGPGRRHLLDLYVRTARPGSHAPVFLHLHGGGFTRGRKNRDARPLLHRLARHGWISVSATYRLLPEGEFPANLEDVQRLIAWVREHADELGADPDRIVIAGSSAGAHLATLAGLTGEPVRGVVALYGYYGRQRSTSSVPSDPRAYGSASAPPFFVVHGEHDTYLSPFSARAFVAWLGQVSGQRVVYAELPGAQHGFDQFYSPRFAAVCDAVEDFATAVTRTSS
ncbi:alpha/beta hydrolase [Aeromicrobium phragmitis]|uniref:Alpha/beta hydrolase n=1 Tax=Aeromicrobium phragmitis TaxID=2478914 RepID=A0A3L8PHL7_9ACTN|nr:alpha/beta hydrolase [Aeromicrobium phragmitis]RLV54756.1 alpha/beta hydrolase [Aeromicrobium phragmitis]